MRNWHKKLINVPSSANGAGVVMGIIDDGLLEFKRSTNNSSSEIGPSDYKTAHPGFENNAGSSETRVFFRKNQESLHKSTEKINIDVVPDLAKVHITGVAGIMVSKNKKNATNNYDEVEGIAPNATLISGLEAIDLLILTNTNAVAKRNIKAPFYSTLVRGIMADDEFIPDGSLEAGNAYSKKSAAIVNLSISVGPSSDVGTTTEFKGPNREECQFLLSELFAYGRGGRGSLIVAAGGNRSEPLTEGTSFIRSSNKALMIAASTIDTTSFSADPQAFDDFANIKEVKADYSNYGNKIDMCAPSTPIGMPGPASLGIYTPTKMFCGELGFEEQYINVAVTEKVSDLQLKLQNVNGIMAGQAIELGNKNSFGNEIRYIKEVDRVSKTITLNKDLFFTKSIPVTSIRVLIFKKNAQRSANPTESHKLAILDSDTTTLSDNQEIYVYRTDMNVGIYTKIVSVNVANKTIECDKSFSTLPVGSALNIIPGQMKLTLKCIEKGRYQVMTPGDTVKGFFPGQQVRIVEYDFVCDLTDFNADTKRIRLSLFPLDKDDVITIESLSYGHYKSKFGGTSGATPIVSGVGALVLAANPTLNAAELKNILKQTTDKIAGAINTINYSAVTDPKEYNYGYTIHDHFGTGRVNATKAVQLASTWNNANTDKPIMRFFDTQNGSAATTVPNSPDIWIADSTSPDNLVPTGTNLYNTFSTANDQKIYVRVRNTGKKESFKENDLRVLVAFTSEQNPVFKFPDCWHENTESATMKTILLNVQEIPPIAPNSNKVLTVNLSKSLKLLDSYNPGPTMKMYILAHIAPFDGPTAEVSLADIKNNKNLTCREIIYTNTSINVKGSTAKVNILNDQNKYELMVDNQTTNKKFSFDNINIASALLDTMQFKFSLINRASNTVEQSVIFKKTNGNWAMDAVPANNWLTASIDITNSPLYATHKNAILNYEFNYNNNDKEIEFNVINA